MRQQVAAIAREAQSAAYREKPKAAPAPVKPRSLAEMVYEPVQPELHNDDGDISDAYLSGMTIQQIADELDLPASEIRARLA